MNTPPILSVVIPTLGRPILVRTVKSLVATHGFDRIEVLVAGNIAAGTVLREIQGLVMQHPQIRHLPVSFEKGDSSEKKNLGCRESRAGLVAFIDDDVVVAPDWPERIMEPFQDPQVGLVSGPSLIPDDVSLMTRLAGVALASKAAGYVAQRYLKGDPEPREVKWSFLIGCNMAYRRSVLELAGMFDPLFWPGEEMIAAFKATQAGHKLVFHPLAYLYHYPRASLGRFLKQIYGYGATRIRLIRAGVEFEASTIVPAAWVASLVVLTALLPWCDVCRYLLLINLALYVMADAWVTAIKALETRRVADLLIFFLIPLMHLSYGMAEWMELAFPGRDLSEK